MNHHDHGTVHSACQRNILFRQAVAQDIDHLIPLYHMDTIRQQEIIPAAGKTQFLLAVGKQSCLFTVKSRRFLFFRPCISPQNRRASQYSRSQRHRQRFHPSGSLSVPHNSLQSSLQLFPAFVQRHRPCMISPDTAGFCCMEQSVSIRSFFIGCKLCDDCFVAGKLAGTVCFPSQKPDKGVKPVQTDDKLHQPFVTDIQPAVMGQFMERRITKILL